MYVAASCFGKANVFSGKKLKPFDGPYPEFLVVKESIVRHAARFYPFPLGIRYAKKSLDAYAEAFRM
jgi:hypothetical protein